MHIKWIISLRNCCIDWTPQHFWCSLQMYYKISVRCGVSGMSEVVVRRLQNQQGLWSVMNENRHIDFFILANKFNVAKTGFFCARWNCWKFSYISLLMWLKGTLTDSIRPFRSSWRWKYRHSTARSPHKYRYISSFELDLSEIYFASISSPFLKWSKIDVGRPKARTNKKMRTNEQLNVRISTYNVRHFQMPLARFAISHYRVMSVWAAFFFFSVVHEDSQQHRI